MCKMNKTMPDIMRIISVFIINNTALLAQASVVI